MVKMSERTDDVLGKAKPAHGQDTIEATEEKGKENA